MGTARPVPAAVGEQTFIEVAGGGFVIGDVAGEPDEAPVTVFVKPFRLMQFEVNNRQFAAFVAATGHITDADWRHPHGSEDAQADNSDHPVVQVSARDAAAFCQWFGGRLPSGAEWEFAARAGTSTPYWWGEEPGENRANCRKCRTEWAGQLSAPVGSFAPNAFGLYDTSGNVWEWVADCYRPSYRGAPEDGTVWEGRGTCEMRSARGGSWYYNPRVMVSASRFGHAPHVGSYNVGFRVARDLN